MKSFQILGKLLLLLFLIFSQACSKEDMPDTNPGNGQLNGTRYKDIVFTDISAATNVPYGENIDQGDAKVTLLMNIYEPANDGKTNRPLIILAHGGGFTEGAKEDFDELAKTFAQSGYVAATISYRLLNNPAGNLSFAVVDAVQDMKAAVRFFTKDNTYKINLNNIFVGGFSAGAVTALHYAYFNSSDISSAPIELQNYISSNGGLSGNSGNPGASETIKGVLNIAGGLYSANWVGANDPILYSIHGSMDTDVYCTIDPEAQNNPNGDFTQGACLIHPIAESLGIINQFRKIEGGNHGAYFTCTDCNTEMRKFVFDNL